MSASDQSAQTNKTDGTDGTVKARVYAVPLKDGQVVQTHDPPTKEIRMCFKPPEEPSENAAEWNPSLLPAVLSKTGSTNPPTLFPVTRQLVSEADTKKSSKTAQSGSK